jgi:CheY-like chemotaxis protein
MLSDQDPKSILEFDDESEIRESSSYNQQLLEGFSILVLEDAPDTREVVRHFLEKAGARVFAAESAQAAWDYLDHTIPTLIVSDIAMPGQDGISFIKELRTQKMSDISAIPALALTAFNDRTVQSLALVSGFQDYLLKPITRRTLVEAVLKLTKAPAGAMTH